MLAHGSRTPNHLLYNIFEEQCKLLETASKIDALAKLDPEVRAVLQQGKVQFSTAQPVFQEIADAAYKIAKKYRDNETGQLAKAMRIFDPAQRHKWQDEDLKEFYRVIPCKFHPNLVSSAEGKLSEWELYLASAMPPKTNLLSWWQSMASLLPILFQQADKMLRTPLVTIQIESSFSTFKQTRHAQQWSMADEVHVARISYSFNGVLAPCTSSSPAKCRKVDNAREEHPPVRKRTAVEKGATESTEMRPLVSGDDSVSMETPESQSAQASPKKVSLEKKDIRQLASGDDSVVKETRESQNVGKASQKKATIEKMDARPLVSRDDSVATETRESRNGAQASQKKSRVEQKDMPQLPTRDDSVSKETRESQDVANASPKKASVEKKDVLSRVSRDDSVSLETPESHKAPSQKKKRKRESVDVDDPSQRLEEE